MNAGAPLTARWATFLRERHHPGTHVVMAVAFGLGNAGCAAALTDSHPSTVRVALAGLLAMVFFLRLRIFDEIKDYAVDLTANPLRPLPRGLVSLAEARRAIGVLAGAELVLAAALGVAGLSAWAPAFLYSLAMYREFWMGAWLRPRMELYALAHTLVASLLGVAVCAWVVGRPFWALPAVVWVVAPANWALFNVFEFSRKTFASEEERPAVESYSSRWGSRGAVALTLSWVAVALACVALSGVRSVPGLDQDRGAALFGLVALGLALPYLLRPRPRQAAWFRASMSGWATLLYIAAGVTGLGRA